MPRRDRRPSSKPLRRRVETRTPRKTLAIYCEGQTTEPEYLEALRRERLVREVAAVDIRIETRGSGNVPLTLVRMAVAARNKALREEAEVDEFWCVFDVEWPRNHPALSEAIDIARNNAINLAISNPCFEFWLILHFKNHREFLDNDAARRLRRRYDGQSDKGLAGSLYMPLRALAAQHAQATDQYHEDNGTKFPHNNPSSGMYRLIQSVSPS